LVKCSGSFNGALSAASTVAPAVVAIAHAAALTLCKKLAKSIVIARLAPDKAFALSLVKAVSSI